MEDDQRDKTAFAALLYRSPGVKPFEAALSLFPDTGRALYVSQHWPRDAFVLDEIARFAGEESAIENKAPDVEDLCAELWSWIQGDKTKFLTFDEKIKAAKLFAEVRGMIKKPEPITNSNVQVNNFAVMEIPVHGEDADWERQLGQQQQGLIAEGIKIIESEANDE